MKKKLFKSVLVAFLVCSSTPLFVHSTFASSIDGAENQLSSNLSNSNSLGVFTTIPDEAEMQRQEQYKLDSPTAWEVDQDGKKKEVPYIVPNDPNLIHSNSFSDANYTYVFDGWTLSDQKQDPKRFFVDKITVENRTSSPLPLKYIQQNSVTSNWEVGANIQAEAELKVKFLASLKATLGGSFNKSKTTSSSTTVEAGPQNVKPGYSASYTKYRSGGYGKGQASWRKYPKNSASWVGMYYTGESGWAVNENATTITLNEYKL